MKKIISLLAAFSVWAVVFAQQDSTQGNQLNDVTVTATKSPKKMSETGKLVTVITGEQILQNAGKDLAQLLNEQAGVTINGANSNPGKDKSLFLLGAPDKYTLILLDGVPLNEPAGVGGSFDLRLLSLDNIERIEILKGSQSTLYGSNAVAGVINLISKKPESKKPQVTGLMSYGSYNSLKGNVGLSQKSKLLEYDVNYTYFKTDGISEARDTSGVSGFDKDGFTKHALQAIVGINVTDRFKLSPYYRFSKFKGGYDADAFTDAPNHYTGSLVNTGLNGHYQYRGGSIYFNYAYDFTKRNYASTFDDFFLKGKFHEAELFVNHHFSAAIQLVTGVSYQSYRMDTPDSVNTIVSPYASLLLHPFKRFYLEAGGRFNHHNQYGNNVTYSFNPSYLFRQNLKVFVNLTSGFRAPSIGELFGPYGANPRLRPENSYTEEAGLQVALLKDHLLVTVDAFNRVIDDVIIYGMNGYENRDRQHDYGAEMSLSYQVNKRLDGKLSYAYIDGRTTEKPGGKDTSFYNLIRRPKHALNFYAGYHVSSRLLLSTTLQFTGKRIDIYYDPVTFDAVQVDLSAYVLWDAHAEYRVLNNRFIFFADIKNLLDKKNYYEIYGYSVQGLNGTAGLRFRLQP